MQEREKERAEMAKSKKKHYWEKESHKRERQSAWWNQQKERGETTTTETKRKKKKEKTNQVLREQWFQRIYYGRKCRGIHWYKWRKREEHCFYCKKANVHGSTSEKVEWVACNLCEKWYYVICEGSCDENLASESYNCELCCLA